MNQAAKRIYILSITISVLVLSSCDTAFTLRDIEIVQLPYRTVYIAGVDDSLDMEGCIILLRARNRRYDMEVIFEEESFAYVTHDIDFSTPGEYEVFFYWGEIQFDSMIIQVVAPD